jgi:hypothetical protein
MKALRAPAILFFALGCTGTVAGPGQTQAGSGGVGSGATGGAAAGTGGAGGSTPLAGSGGATSGTGGSAGSSTAGTASGGSAGIAGMGGSDPVSCDDGLTSRRVRRLSWREYANVVGSLLGDAAAAEALATLPGEPRLGGFDNQDSALRVNGALAETLSDLAASLAAKTDVATLAPCAEPDGSTSCLDSFARSFAESAYGRPITEEEAARMATVAALGENYETSVRLVVELVLQSPSFLYLSELGAPDAPVSSGQPVALTSYEIASQLSFLLSGRRPDADLLAWAAGGAATPDAVRAEAERLLATSDAAAQLHRFVLGWLDMAPIADAPKSPDFFPDVTPEIVAAMQTELDTFVAAQLGGGDGTLAALMTAPSTEIPPALLPFYGSDYTPGTGLDPTRRGGVLSLPGVLAYHAARDHSGPVERGLLVRRQLLCMAVGSPPPEVLMRIADNPIRPEDETTTTRQKFAQHATDPACQGCHTQFDPIGFGLEQMDGVGRFRTTENDLPVDSRGELFDTDIDGPFEGVVELSQKLLGSEMFERCMVSHYFRFAEARPAAAGDQCVVNDWSLAFTQGGGRFRDLVLASVSHPAFSTRKDDR